MMMTIFRPRAREQILGQWKLLKNHQYSDRTIIVCNLVSDHNALSATLEHTSFLEELVFWTVKYEFPEKLVCLLLKMLPDRKYKEAFTTSFVLHYSRQVPN